METRVLIPNGLRIVVTDEEAKEDVGLKLANLKKTVDKEEENEEKPSSSSGHCETPENQRERLKKDKIKRKDSSCNDEDNSWKKKHKDQFTSSASSSSSSSSSPSPAFSDSLSSENEAEVNQFTAKCRKSERLVGSSYKASESKNLSSSSKTQENEAEKAKNASHVKICVTRVIEKGTVLTPNDGDVQVVHLKGIPAIPKDDIRFIFGCFETITPISTPSTPPYSSSGSDPLISPASTTTTTATSPPLQDEVSKSEQNTGNNFVRLCNWIRFLRRSNNLHPATTPRKLQKTFKLCSDSEEDNADTSKNQRITLESNPNTSIFHVKQEDDVPCPNFSNDLAVYTATGKENCNIVARFVDGRPIFEAMERLVPGTELVAHFDMNSVLSYAAAHSPYMTKMITGNNPATTTPKCSPVMAKISSSPPPPAPHFNSLSTRGISSSSPVHFTTVGNNVGHGGNVGVKNEREEREVLLVQQQQPHHQRQLPVFPYSFHSIYSNARSFSSTYQYWPSNGFQRDARYGKVGKEDERKKHESLLANVHLGLAEGPLDLTKLPDFRKGRNTPLNEPLKVGTPFDSPDSNDDDMVKSIPSPEASRESGSSSLFSIRNVLKRQSSEQPSKLFQPYSMEIGRKASERETLLKALTSQSSSVNSAASSALVTPPSSSDTSLNLRNSTGLRPILRTRGRERSLLPCEVCGKAFDRPSLLKRHLRTHTGEKPHVCDVCSKGFSTSSSLNTHRRIHSGEKPHQCPICGKRFTASSNLYYHRMTHNKEKPHKCMLCGKSFPTPGDLKSHQYVHSGSWPYTCPVCHRGFSKQTNLRNHLLLHSGMTGGTAGCNKSVEKPHTCQICDKKFAQACNLRAHIKTHEESDSSSSTCLVCKRSSTETLLNGRCRSCMQARKGSDAFTINHHRESTSSSPSTTTTLPTVGNDKMKEGRSSSYDVPSLLSHRMVSTIGNAAQQPLPLAPTVGHFGLSMPQFHGLAGIPGLSSGLSFPTSSGNLNFPINANHPGSSVADLFGNAGTAPTARNTLLEQLVEWNYRMAKESVGIGSLGFSIMQQKLLESRMLAAQIINTHGFGMNGGMQDLLGLRSATGVPGESEFMQR